MRVTGVAGHPVRRQLQSADGERTAAGDFSVSEPEIHPRETGTALTPKREGIPWFCKGILANKDHKNW